MLQLQPFSPQFKNLISQFTGACFIHRKVRVLCFALPELYFKGQIIFFSIIVKLFFFFLLFFYYRVRA